MSLDRIPIDIIKEYLYIKAEKSRVIKKQNFDAAIEYRKAEKETKVGVFYFNLIFQYFINISISKLLFYHIWCIHIFISNT